MARLRAWVKLRGFSLIELLVVIVIIAILISSRTVQGPQDVRPEVGRQAGDECQGL